MPQPELTQRQSQILKLLQAGKVNKEVARELGIGVGTVKQHIVALFKKLNVSNRAMAVSRGKDMCHEQESHGSALTVEGLLERRPCVVLSISLPEEASPQAVRLMYGTLAAFASAKDAIFLARQGNAGDVIIGIQRGTEYDAAIALQAAQMVYDDLQVLDVDMAEKMHGCISAGLAVASMKRLGGWTGEVIASAVIASARDLLKDTPPGWLAFDSAVLDLMTVFGIGGQHEVTPLLPFDAIKNLHWTGSRRSYPLVGRDAELAQLVSALNEAVQGRGGVIHIEGELGMGKSRLCEEISQHCLGLGGKASFHRSTPLALGKCLYDTDKGGICSAEEIAALLQAKPGTSPELNIVDDFHLLPAEQQGLLSAASHVAAGNGRLVIFSGRRGVSAIPDKDSGGDHPAERIKLRRMSAETVETLVRETLGNSATAAHLREIKAISSAAAGVPLFVVELARHPAETRLTLPLLVVVNARLDSMRLDRVLLSAVAKKSVAATLEEIAATLDEDAESLRPQAERAAAAGVLSCDATGGLSFTHPLLHRTIDTLAME